MNTRLLFPRSICPSSFFFFFLTLFSHVYSSASSFQLPPSFLICFAYSLHSSIDLASFYSTLFPSPSISPPFLCSLSSIHLSILSSSVPAGLHTRLHLPKTFLFPHKGRTIPVFTTWTDRGGEGAEGGFSREKSVESVSSVQFSSGELERKKEMMCVSSRLV